MKDFCAPEVHVGILKSKQVRFWLTGEYRYHGNALPEGEAFPQGEAEVLLGDGVLELHAEGRVQAMAREVILRPADPQTGRFGIHDVVIGIEFHWERKEDQLFSGAIKMIQEDGMIRIVNVVNVEDYLVSVISSEMRGDSNPELLRAHTLISRSWLLAQMEKQEDLIQTGAEYQMVRDTDESHIRWYDREDHTLFHVCADDHCQRYQGITRASNPEVVRAVEATRGEVIAYEDKIADARFSKCCGGVTEQFEYCWEPVEHPYLQRIDDRPGALPGEGSDLKLEANARDFIMSSPEAFCNTQDAKLLSQVLNDYDQESPDFYRWKVEYGQEELAGLIARRSGIDFGQILDLQPIERGESGRLVRLRITGSLRSMVVGKELEIRRWLSESHLYSSAFMVEKEDVSEGIPGRFILHGAGWGHGVGLCQIGAAAMASQGYSYEEIISHYFRNASIEKRYE